MRDDPTSVQIIRILVTLVGLAGIVAGVYLFENGPGDAISASWGWILDSILGGGALGLGIGMGVYGVNGEGEWLERLRAKKKRPEELKKGVGDRLPPLDEEGSP
jgi:hypothetical protein